VDVFYAWVQKRVCFFAILFSMMIKKSFEKRSQKRLKKLIVKHPNGAVFVADTNFDQYEVLRFFSWILPQVMKEL
jgi:hypothetical protein